MAAETLKLVTRAQKTTRTRLDTISFTKDEAREWALPPFQRPLSDNSKLAMVVSEINATEVIPGILTFGILEGKKYLLDGQHRREAFMRSVVERGFADARICEFDDMSGMAAEVPAVEQPDRAHEARRHPEVDGNRQRALRRLRKRCPFIGYSHIRNGPTSPIVSMSAVLRVWFGSASEAPVGYATAMEPGGSGRASAADCVESMTETDAAQLINFMEMCFSAWGRDDVHARLYGGLNLGLCAWLYRRTVINPYSSVSVRLTDELFKKCLAAVAASADYVDFLLGRTLRERDRAPGYSRLRAIFVSRIEAETGSRARFPKPEWATH